MILELIHWLHPTAEQVCALWLQMENWNERQGGCWATDLGNQPLLNLPPFQPHIVETGEPLVAPRALSYLGHWYELIFRPLIY